MQIQWNAISRTLGVFGTAVGIIGGIVAIAPHLKPSPAVQMKIEKGQIQGFPGADDPYKPATEIPGDFGYVIVSITNKSQSDIPTPQLKFKYLRNFKGIVVVDGLPPVDAKQWESKANEAITKNPTDPVIALPQLLKGASVTVQVFGSDWKYTDPDLYGAEPQKIWVITVEDSYVHRLLFEHHLWILSVLMFVLGSVLLIIYRPSKGHQFGDAGPH